MPPVPPALARVRALADAGLMLARSAPSGRFAMARAAVALDPAWLPRALHDELWPELEAARDAAAQPIAFGDIEKLLRAAWGAKASDELDALDREPVAVTPTAQVHRGEVDGEAVAVKVRRPGLTASIRQDLTLLEQLSRPLAAAFPEIDPGGLMREIRERTLEELDLEHAAEAQRRFHRALRRHEGLFVPAPVTRLSHESVMVSAWVEGTPLPEAADRDAAAALLVRFVLGGLREGLVHADADPADALVLADGRLALIDLGSVRDVDPARADHVLAALDALLADDAAAFGRALAALGMLPEELGGEALALAREALGPLLGESTLDADAVCGARDRLFGRVDLVGRLVPAGRMAPEDLWPVRAAGQLFGSLARAGARGDWPALGLAALREGWG